MSTGNNQLPAASTLPPGSPINANVGIAPLESSLSDSWLVVRKRKWIIVCAALLGAIIGVMTALSTPKVYEATGNIQVHPGESEQYRVDATGGSGGIGGDDIGTRLETEVAILQSQKLELQVARQLNLANDMAFLHSKRPVSGQRLDDPRTTLKILDIFSKSLQVKRVPKTELIAISFTSTSPELASNIVNTLVVDYIDRSYRVRFDSTQRVSGWLSGQLNGLKDEVESNQEKMVGLQRQLGVIGFDDKHNLVADQLEYLTKAVTEARINRIVNETRYRVMSTTDPNLLEAETGSTSSGSGVSQSSGTLLGSLRSQLSSDEAKYAQLQTQFGSKWPDVVQLKAQIAEEKRSIAMEEQRVVEQSKVAFSAAKSTEDMAEAALNQKESEAFESRDALVQYAILQQRFQSSRDLYEGLTRRLREAGITAGLQSTEIDVVDAALIPVVPTGPRRLSIVFMGTLFGMIGGVALAFLMESLDTSLRSIAEIEAVMELPSLAVIPRARRNMARAPGEATPAIMRNIDVVSQPKSQFSESFRALRTSLMLSTVGHPPRVVLITSSIPSEGKTTVATNLAAALSQRDVKVLLIDADLRRPTVHHRFGLSAKAGLTTVLANTTTLEDTLQTSPDLPNLDILASGPVPPFPTEMIASERMAQILEEVKGKYEHRRFSPSRTA
jgi:uncharacterized protein involved in exopolysaccharide biosynthesis